MEIKKDPTAKFVSGLVKKLQELKEKKNISDLQYKQLYTTSTVIPRFYGLPKIHKQGVPLRPIVASRGSFTYPVAKHLSKILSPMVGKNGLALKNSTELVSTLRDCKLDETDILVSFDVTALFTSVPVEKSLEIIQQRLMEDTTLGQRTEMTAGQITDLLSICLKSTYFQFNNTIYTQIEGAAMGSPVSPIVANLFMEWFELKAIHSFQYEVTIWRRYVDDTIVALCDELLDEFTDHINAIHPAIKFTRELEQDYNIAMLDANIKRNLAGNLTFSVYRKPTHTDQYLQFSSNQPLQHKLGVIRTLYHRCKTICSTEEAKEKEIDHLQRVLSISGYTKSSWKTATQKKDPKQGNDTRGNNSKGEKPKGFITLPYIGTTSDAIARVIRKTGVQVHLRPFNTIRNRLVHPKDKITNDEKAGVVYHIKCGECDVTYVGETERRLSRRIKEHHRDSSPVGHHLKYRNHSISELDINVLHQESDWFRRGVAEAIHILQDDPPLNRDRGRHTLSNIYREIISSRDITSSPQSRDDANHTHN